MHFCVATIISLSLIIIIITIIFCVFSPSPLSLLKESIKVTINHSFYSVIASNKAELASLHALC